MNKEYKNNPAIEELMAAAFECLLLHPGSSREDWQRILMEQYRAEICDAIGDETRVEELLSALWETPYRDIATGVKKPLKSWAHEFADTESLNRYYNKIATKT